MSERRTIVIGHKNPDTDSCAAALGYAELKTRLGQANVTAACAGFPNARTEYLFNRFNTPLPPVIEDVSPRVGDVMDTSPTVVYKGQTLLEAMEYIQESRMSRIPVIDSDRYVGMVSLFDLAGRLFQKARETGSDSAGDGVVGRSVTTSIALAAKTLNARVVALGCDKDELRELNVYVGAMSLERLRERVLDHDRSTRVVVVGDRADVHELLVKSGVVLMIVTGNTGIDLGLVREAQEVGVSILQTGYDSATTVRRLKFSQPAELMLQADVSVYRASDKVSDIYHAAMSRSAENFPVVDGGGRLLGVVTKHHLDSEPPVQLVLVDHNELDQAVNGAAETPIVEILDHHRIGMLTTSRPIVITNDVVGSASTLVTEQYRRFGVEPSPQIAGILMGGVATDTLLLRSPTSTDRDRAVLEYLEELSGVKAGDLLDEIFAVGSLIGTESARAVVYSDKKDYKTESFTFCVSQVEESDFENFETHRDELFCELRQVVESEGAAIAMLLVTDVVHENSRLLAAGQKRLMNALPYRRLDEHLSDLPGILSRKKQLLPVLFKVFAKM